jgi:enoyl-CoA hydratase
MTLATQFLRVSYPAEGVAQVDLDHPPANALVPELYDELRAVVTELEDDARARAVIFTSANEKIFAAGTDLKRLGGIEPSRGSVAARVDRAHATFLRLQRLGKPTIGVLEGHALGGGCELALALDFRFMTRGRARIGLPEVTLGLIPAAGGTQRLPRLVGRLRASELMMLGERLDADAAERIGLVTRACDDAREEAFELALRLVKMPRSSLRAIKQCLNDGFDGDLMRGLAVERSAAIEVMAADEAREGVAAFLEGREPQFP